MHTCKKRGNGTSKAINCSECKRVWRATQNAKRRDYAKAWRQSRRFQFFNENDIPVEKKYDWEKHLKRTYGLTIEQYLAMLRKANGKCTLCGKTASPSRRNHGGYGRTLNIDHNHATGKVRGLLCTRCNIGVSYLEQDGWLDSALQYLSVHNG